MKKTKEITQIALFTALSIILSQIVIPVTPVPISLSLVGVYLSGFFLGWKKGFAAQVIYILLGVVGLPVFASFKGGLPVLFGPTGGYIFGYLVAVVVVGLITEKRKSSLYIVSSMSLGCVSCYLIGTLWLAKVWEISFYDALLAGVVPFIPGDMLKIAVSAWIARKVDNTYSRLI